MKYPKYTPKTVILRDRYFKYMRWSLGIRDFNFINIIVIVISLALVIILNYLVKSDNGKTMVHILTTVFFAYIGFTLVFNLIYHIYNKTKGNQIITEYKDWKYKKKKELLQETNGDNTID